jgi:hypothetical protein
MGDELGSQLGFRHPSEKDSSKPPMPEMQWGDGA